MHTILSHMSAYVKGYNGQTIWIYFLIEDDSWLQKNNIIWNKVSTDIKKEYDSKPAYNKNFWKI